MALRVLSGIFLLGGYLSQAHEGNLGAGRQLFHWSTEKRMIWGHCDQLDREITGCNVQGTCAAYMSPGPADADVEVTLGGLPASTASNDVHLHWWAARRSPSQWDPLTSPVHASVYRSMTDAYPKFFEPAFNGGNVKVNETGHATIRVRAPAAYLVWPYLAIPNIKLRLCRNETFMQHVADRVVFGVNEQWLVTGSETAGMQILQMREYTPPPGTPVPNASQPFQAVDWKALQPRPIGYVARIEKTKPQTSTLAATITSTTKTTTSTTAAEATTTVVVPVVQGMDLEAARDALDLDALEFSPVYVCLSRGLVYDHFTDDCASSCPEGTVVEHGQCVRPLTSEGTKTLSADWQLQVRCNPVCTLDRTNMTLHGLRLSIAGHLDLPFQEVEVAYGYQSSVARRLIPSPTKVLQLKVTVSTGRLSETDGTVLLTSWLSGADHASQLLGLEVQTVSNTRSGSDGFTQGGNLGANNDPYAPAYDSISENVHQAGHHSTLAAAGQDTGLVTPELIAGIAGGVVFIGVVVGAALFFQRRRMRLNAAREAQNNKLGSSTNPVKAAPAEEEQQGEENEAPKVAAV